MSHFRRCSVTLALFIYCTVLSSYAAEPAPADIPQAADSRLLVERFAAAPDIVHPINLAFDNRGRLLVIESHTHFRPPNYQGPPHDRIRLLEDTDGDGKADRITTFFEGTRMTMDIAVHPDGSVYVATRNEILRLRDTDGDGKADQQDRIVFLDTKGNYPHNGLSGLTFDSQGNLFFGLGENLGADYKLSGSDGTTLTGGGEGGNVYWCTADGKKLRRVATGFWNPFGLGLDVFGRLFAVDNDPDAMPPCRMVHVVEDGDYGYQFRYGRSGRHPFQAWDGQLPGTLPMVAGTGEAPCKVVSYQSDALPREYLGSLLVTAWADHRVERYVLSDRGASVAGERKPFVQGSKDFRPVGLAVAPDGSLFVSDWVLRDYNLHGHGAIWHIRPRQATQPDRPQDPRRALASLHRPLREAAARQLAQQGEPGRSFLRDQLHHDDPRRRAAALTALLDAKDAALDLTDIADTDPLPPLRALAVHALVARGRDAERFLDSRYPPAVRREAIASLGSKSARSRLLPLLVDADPFLRQAAVRQLAHSPDLLADLNLRSLDNAQQRMAVLLAQRAGGRPEALRLMPQFLADADPEVRFLAAKWIADEKLTAFRPALVEHLKDPQLSVRLYLAYTTALARIDGRAVSEAEMADFFLGRLTDPQSAPAVLIAALRLIPPAHKRLSLEILTRLLQHEDAGVQLEAVRILNEHPNRRRLQVLAEVIQHPRYPEAVRAEAVIGVAERAEEIVAPLLALVQGDNAALRNEALRALVQTRLAPPQRALVEEAAQKHPDSADLAARVLGKPFAKDRPAAADLTGWLKRLEGSADAAAGRRVFFQVKLAACSRCHRVDGRGADVGPDLSAIGRTEHRQLVESILQPSNQVAPHYQVWSLATTDGKVLTGMLLRTELDEYTYVDVRGEPFKINTRTIVESRPVPTSLMPDGQADLLTDQELRDLLAYLGSRR